MDTVTRLCLHEFAYKKANIRYTMKNQKVETYIGVRVPKKLKQEIKTTIKNGVHLNEADFVREALREKLAKLKEDILIG